MDRQVKLDDIDDLIEEFELAWVVGEAPEIRIFLDQAQSHETNNACRAATLAELIKIDLHYCWQAIGDGRATRRTAHQRLFVEDYLVKFPSEDMSGHLLPLLEEEFLVRVLAKDSPSLNEFSERFPELAAPQLAKVKSRAEEYLARSGCDSGGKQLTFEERFEIRRLLGQGGMGRVYLALDPRLQREVAVKVPIMDLRHDDPARTRFLREGQLAASLSHPNVVTIYEIGATDHHCFIVAEYVDGPTLRDWLLARTETLSPGAAADLVRALARAVQAAHSQGVLHRDLKPANVLMETSTSEKPRTEGWIYAGDSNFVRPRITDFGLASCVGELSALTTSGAVIGTAAYMAPEQATGLEIGPQADVYSLGLILYEILFGVRPFEGKSVVDVVDRFRGTKPILLPETPVVPRDLRTICERCLQFDVRDRYATSAELADDLQRFMDGKTPLAKPISSVAKFRRFTSMPARLGQAAYSALAIETAIIGSLTVAVVLQCLGIRTGNSRDSATFAFEVAVLAATQLIPILALAILTLRKKLWAFLLNCLWVTAMAGIVLLCLVTGNSPLTYYGDNDLAFFAAHILILGLAIVQLTFHLVAVPAAMRVLRLEGRWV